MGQRATKCVDPSQTYLRRECSAPAGWAEDYARSESCWRRVCSAPARAENIKELLDELHQYPVEYVQEVAASTQIVPSEGLHQNPGDTMENMAVSTQIIPSEMELLSKLRDYSLEKVEEVSVEYVQEVAASTQIVPSEGLHQNPGDTMENMAVSTQIMPSEMELLSKLRDYSPEKVEEVSEGFTPPPFLQATASDDERAQHKQKSTRYLEVVKHAFTAFATGADSAVYLGLQPMFSLKGGAAEGYRLSGLEVLARVKNGQDGAPMPGMAQWQREDHEGRINFCRKQLDFAAEWAPKFPCIDLSVNLRPDELNLVQEKIIDSVRKANNIIIEITEYAPITDEVIVLIRKLRQKGVRFSLDDVTKVVEKPTYGYAQEGAHACSFEFGKRHAELFDVQKLNLPLAACAWRMPVFPKPHYAGGQANQFFAKQIIPHEKGDPIPEAILERKEEIENWVREVKVVNNSTKFIIECSLHEEDLEGKEGLLPELNLLDGDFSMQGGVFGGRCFPPEVLLAAMDCKKPACQASHQASKSSPRPSKPPF